MRYENVKEKICTIGKRVGRGLGYTALILGVGVYVGLFGVFLTGVWTDFGREGGTNNRYSDNYIDKIGSFRGYQARVIRRGVLRKVILADTTKHPEEFIYGLIDRPAMRGERRFDQISLEQLSEGHPLEKYANVDSLETAYREITMKPK